MPPRLVISYAVEALGMDLTEPWRTLVDASHGAMTAEAEKWMVCSPHQNRTMVGYGTLARLGMQATVDDPCMSALDAVEGEAFSLEEHVWCGDPKRAKKIFSAPQVTAREFTCCPRR
jgi:hypothetical protein